MLLKDYIADSRFTWIFILQLVPFDQDTNLQKKFLTLYLVKFSVFFISARRKKKLDNIFIFIFLLLNFN